MITEASYIYKSLLMLKGIKTPLPLFFSLVVFISEVNLFWAAHQVHHSSEDYTLSTALRQSVLQRLTSWVSMQLVCCMHSLCTTITQNNVD